MGRRVSWCAPTHNFRNAPALALASRAQLRLTGACRAQAVLGGGDYFGEIGLMGKRARVATCKAKGAATCLKIPGKTFEKCMHCLQPPFLWIIAHRTQPPPVPITRPLCRSAAGLPDIALFRPALSGLRVRNLCGCLADCECAKCSSFLARLTVLCCIIVVGSSFVLVADINCVPTVLPNLESTLENGLKLYPFEL